METTIKLSSFQKFPITIKALCCETKAWGGSLEQRTFLPFLPALLFPLLPEDRITFVSLREKRIRFHKGIMFVF